MDDDVPCTLLITPKPQYGDHICGADPNLVQAVYYTSRSQYAVTLVVQQLPEARLSQHTCQSCSSEPAPRTPGCTSRVTSGWLIGGG
jgi:hypothetical protein